MQAAPFAWIFFASSLQSCTQPLLAGYWINAAKNSPANAASHSGAELAITICISSGAARVCMTSMVWGWQSPATTNTLLLLLTLRLASVIASAADVASSSMEALAMAMPVRSQTMVWKLISASSRPCEISAWYGV